MYLYDCKMLPLDIHSTALYIFNVMSQSLKSTTVIFNNNNNIRNGRIGGAIGCKPMAYANNHNQSLMISFFN